MRNTAFMGLLKLEVRHIFEVLKFIKSDGEKCTTYEEVQESKGVTIPILF